jgi:hypothetical protein
MRTGVARLDIPFRSGSHEAAAPDLRSPKRLDARCAAVAHRTDASAGAPCTDACRRAECAAPKHGPAAPNLLFSRTYSGQHPSLLAPFALRESTRPDQPGSRMAESAAIQIILGHPKVKHH